MNRVSIILTGFLLAQTPMHNIMPSGGGSVPTPVLIDFQANTTPFSMTGSLVTIYSTAGVTLAAGQCITIAAAGTSSGVSATLAIYADAILIHTVYANGSMGILTHSSYCNNPGSLTVQTRFDISPPFYECSGDGSLTVATCAVVSSDGASSTPSSVNWGTGHTLTLKATAASGTVSGAWWKITNG
jgi:hypothetical protein